MRLPCLAATLFTLLLAGCHAAPTSETSPLELRTYEVPKGTARPLLATIKDALWMEDFKGTSARGFAVGRVVITPAGQLAVLAPTNVQVGVEKLVQSIADHPPALEQTIELHYFVVVGTPAATPAAAPAGVKEIQPALDEIIHSQGPQTFTLAQRIALSSLTDEEGRLDGDELEIRQRAVETGTDVYAMLTVRYGKTDKIETRIRLAEGRIVVLGAMGQHGAAAAPDGSTLYYIVRVAPHVDGKHP